MRWAFLLLLCSTANAADWTDDWDALLKKHVDDRGRVDYARVKSDDGPRFDRVVAAVAQLQNADEASLVNAYNVLVWQNVLSGKKPADQRAFFYDSKLTVAGQTTNLADFETKIRKTYKDPRLHMALNCASLGCPRLPREAFRKKTLDAQLERETKVFCNEKRNVELGADGRLRLSQIFEWYRDDFGDAIAFINRYRDEKLPASAKIDYIRYDWTTNNR